MKSLGSAEDVLIGVFHRRTLSNKDASRPHQRRFNCFEGVDFDPIGLVLRYGRDHVAGRTVICDWNVKHSDE